MPDWNRSANDWIVIAPDSVAFHFFMKNNPMSEGACGILVRAGEANRVRLGECLTVIEYQGDFDPCWAKEAYAWVLGVQADPTTCEVTTSDADAVVAKLGKPWTVTVLPAE